MFEPIPIDPITASISIKTGLAPLFELKKTGFCVIKNHPINTDLIRAVYEHWAIYFNKRTSDKKQGLQKPSGHYDYWEEDKAFQKIGVPKASFYFNNKTRLSDDCSDLQTTTLQLFHELSSFAQTILETLTNELSDYIKRSIKSIRQYDESLRIIHSPTMLHENKFESINLPIRNRAHEDIDVLTLLPSATIPGLQYLSDMGWETVQYEFGDIIVNAGDAFNLLTNGIIKSPTHRVVALDKESAESERFSMAYFLSIA